MRLHAENLQPASPEITLLPDCIAKRRVKHEQIANPASYAPFRSDCRTGCVPWPCWFSGVRNDRCSFSDASAGRKVARAIWRRVLPSPSQHPHPSALAFNGKKRAVAGVLPRGLQLRGDIGCDARAGLGGGARGSFSAPDPLEAARRLAEEQAEAEKRAKQAHNLWLEAQSIGGSLAEAYLRGRAIATALPDTLRFHPACWHAATAKRLPAMIAEVEGCERFAVHRTYLAPDGRGKAPGPTKQSDAGGRHGWRGRLSEAPERLVVAEGIETALSLLVGRWTAQPPYGRHCPPAA